MTTPAIQYVNDSDSVRGVGVAVAVPVFFALWK